jgi:hypothetical protein
MKWFNNKKTKINLEKVLEGTPGMQVYEDQKQYDVYSDFRKALDYVVEGSANKALKLFDKMAKKCYHESPVNKAFMDYDCSYQHKFVGSYYSVEWNGSSYSTRCIEPFTDLCMIAGRIAKAAGQEYRHFYETARDALKTERGSFAFAGYVTPRVAGSCLGIIDILAQKTEKIEQEGELEKEVVEMR